MKFIVSVIIALPLFCSANEELIWPPAGTKTVKVFSFTGGPSDLIYNDGSLHVSASPQSGIILTEEQAAKATAALNTKEVPYGPSAMCFEPRDAVAFYDKDNNVIASVSICFTCCRTRIEPASLSRTVNYVELAKFFAPLQFKGGYVFQNGNPDAYIEHYMQRVARWKQKVLERGQSKTR